MVRIAQMRQWHTLGSLISGISCWGKLAAH